ncbi:MAG: hypothetical protein AAGF28_12580 [Pseudomonadota bacterium]
MSTPHRFELLEQVRGHVADMNSDNRILLGNEISRKVLRITTGLSDQADWCDWITEAVNAIGVAIVLGVNPEEYRVECFATLDQLEQKLFAKTSIDYENIWP